MAKFNKKKETVKEEEYFAARVWYSWNNKECPSNVKIHICQKNRGSTVRTLCQMPETFNNERYQKYETVKSGQAKLRKFCKRCMKYTQAGSFLKSYKFAEDKLRYNDAFMFHRQNVGSVVPVVVGSIQWPNRMQYGTKVHIGHVHGDHITVPCQRHHDWRVRNTVASKYRLGEFKAVSKAGFSDICSLCARYLEDYNKMLRILGLLKTESEISEIEKGIAKLNKNVEAGTKNGLGRYVAADGSVRKYFLVNTKENHWVTRPYTRAEMSVLLHDNPDFVEKILGGGMFLLRADQVRLNVTFKKVVDTLEIL